MANNTLSLEEAAAQIRSKALSPVELTKECLARSEAVQAKTGAFVVITADAALAAARQAEREIAAGKYRGPLHGIPVAVKDLCDMKGLPTTASSKVRHDHVAPSDSAVVERFNAAGAVIIGKTNTHEFAYGVITPTTRNPWDLNRIPGGSSGGSGATVAAQCVFSAIGTDTGGSIRIPASVCGTVGLKPTYGRVSRHGITSLSWSLDHAGPLTRRVRDAALSLNALAGYDARDPGSADVPVPDFLDGIDRGVKGLRLGVPRNYFFDGIEAGVEAAVRAAIEHLAKQGATVVPLTLPMADLYASVEFGLVLPEASAYHQEMLRARADLYEPDVRIMLQAGELIAATDYIKALRVRELIKRAWAEMYRGIDVLLAPTVPAIAAKVGQESFRWSNGAEEPVTPAYVRTSCPANITGLPSITLPCGFVEGMPVGMQIMGRPYDERTILRVAQTYEASTDWHKRAPAL
jgi:aspartyl-tRNA(Asn)/glutamyl-tRNA(Gln) amidotransferase subunit A